MIASFARKWKSRLLYNSCSFYLCFKTAFHICWPLPICQGGCRMGHSSDQVLRLRVTIEEKQLHCSNEQRTRQKSFSIATQHFDKAASQCWQTTDENLKIKKNYCTNKCCCLSYSSNDKLWNALKYNLYSLFKNCLDNLLLSLIWSTFVALGLQSLHLGPTWLKRERDPVVNRQDAETAKICQYLVRLQSMKFSRLVPPPPPPPSCNGLYSPCSRA